MLEQADEGSVVLESRRPSAGARREQRFDAAHLRAVARRQTSNVLRSVSTSSTCTPTTPSADGEPLAPLPAAGGDVLRDLAAAQVVTLAELSAAGVILLFVANFLRPLVFAHVNGLQVLGAELPLPTSRRPDAALRLCLPHADG